MQALGVLAMTIGDIAFRDEPPFRPARPDRKHEKRGRGSIFRAILRDVARETEGTDFIPRLQRYPY